MRKAKTGELVELTTVSFTIEGAAIFTDVYFDGSAYLMVKDCSRDAWDVEAGIEIETYACCGWVRSEPPDPEASASVTLILTDQPVESRQELREIYEDSEKQPGIVFWKGLQ